MRLSCEMFIFEMKRPAERAGAALKPFRAVVLGICLKLWRRFSRLCFCSAETLRHSAITRLTHLGLLTLPGPSEAWVSLRYGTNANADSGALINFPFSLLVYGASRGRSQPTFLQKSVGVNDTKRVVQLCRRS